MTPSQRKTMFCELGCYALLIAPFVAIVVMV